MKRDQDTKPSSRGILRVKFLPVVLLLVLAAAVQAQDFIYTTSNGAITITDGWSYFSDPDWTNYPGRFYRLRSPSGQTFPQGLRSL